MIERFCVQINSPRPGLNATLLEKAVNRIYQAALLHRVAVVSTSPGTLTPRSVIVVDADVEEDWVEDIIELEPGRLVGIYTRGDRSHAELLDALKEDLAEAAREMEQAA